MSLSLWVFIVSGILLLLLVTLLWIEEGRGRRLFLATLRYWLDVKVLSLNYLLSRVSISWGGGAVRITFHFLMHKVLGTILSTLKSLEYKVTHLQRQNRSVVRTFTTVKEKNHLDLIAEHQVHTALSEGEKQKRKNKAIEAN